MAEGGFIVVQIDGLGTNHRGQKFQQVAYKNLKDSGFPDRIKWMKAAAAEHPEMAAALQDRVRLMEQRADELIERARTANAPWLAQLGAEPADAQECASWRARARTVVAYRERHQITDQWGHLGTVDERNSQQRREAALAASAMTDLRQQQQPAVRRPTLGSAPATQHSDAIGR